MKKYIFIITLLLSIKIVAQRDFGSWNITNINIKLDPKWKVFAETQLRSLSFYNEFHYYEYKAGFSYKIEPNFYLSTGIGSYNTFSEGGNFQQPAQNKEVRTWIQVNMKNPLEFVTFEHRYRAEQRFTSNGYRNRFRYRLTASIPVCTKKSSSKPINAIFWNELFFTDKEPFFERNRMFLGGDYPFSKNLTLQLGYIHQFDYKINDETGRDFLNISFLYQIDLSKKN